MEEPQDCKETGLPVNEAAAHVLFLYALIQGLFITLTLDIILKYWSNVLKAAYYQGKIAILVRHNGSSKHLYFALETRKK